MINVPPLRQRKEDIEILASTFLKDFCKRMNITVKGISPDARRMLQEYSWPGNVRELKNLIESIIVLNKGEVIKVSDLPENLRRNTEFDRTLPVPLKISPEQAERELIYRTLLVLGSELAEIKSLLIENFGVQSRHIKYEKIRYGENGLGEEILFNENIKDSEISLKNKEKELIINALSKNKGNRKKAAKDLGISERTLYRKIKQLNF